MSKILVHCNLLHMHLFQVYHQIITWPYTHPFTCLGKRCINSGLPTQGFWKLKSPMSQVQAYQQPITGNGVALWSTNKEGGNSPNARYHSNNQNWKQVARVTSNFLPQGGQCNHLTTNNSGELKSPTKVGKGWICTCK